MPTASSPVAWLQAAAQYAAANSSSGSGSAAAFSDQVLVSRAAGLVADWKLLDLPRPNFDPIQHTYNRVVSLSTCTKVGAISFVVGIPVGFMLKRRLRNWAARLLKRIKDDN